MASSSTVVKPSQQATNDQKPERRPYDNKKKKQIRQNNSQDTTDHNQFSGQYLTWYEPPYYLDSNYSNYDYQQTTRYSQVHPPYNHNRRQNQQRQAQRPMQTDRAENSVQRWPPVNRPESSTQRKQQTNHRKNPSGTASNSSTTEVEYLRAHLTEQLLKNNYECMICINKIQREKSIWSCEICFKMFHLNCIEKWAKSEESGSNLGWRCPGCQYSYASMPKYSCFCLKMDNPPYHPGEIPHSCGETCGKKLNKKSEDCRHLCTELCHPGPCPKCNSMTKRSCSCGKESHQVMCSSDVIIKCDNPCGKLKSCQYHTCQLVCHSRQCEPCDVMVEQYCHSHNTARQVLCTAETGNMTSYNCGQTCEKLLACGHHKCPRTCHEGPCPECILLPENCNRCACGKTVINAQQRKSCLDPLPTCDDVCGKPLSCGSEDDTHRCTAPCHNGPCPECNRQSNLICRCGHKKETRSCSEVLMYDSTKNPYLCERRCNKKKICGKHRCNEVCCNRDIHICEVICDKMLNCGNHKCTDLCHRNSCRQCPVVSYDELACRCGRTISQPPIKCGTALPSCNYPCNRNHACDHPIYHTCHDSEECPPCPQLVSKLCYGGHTMRDNVLCHLKEVFCGQPCGKQLPCGVHKCFRSCHSGLCQIPNQKCAQKCSIKRRECDHPCNALCHGQDSCPLTTCKEKIQLKCPCGRIVKEIVCNSEPQENNSAPMNDTNLAQSIAEVLSVRTIDISLSRKQNPLPAQLECDEQCFIEIRNRKLAEALSINLDEQRTTTVIYTDFLKEYAKKNLEFVQMIERLLTQLVEETQRYRVSKRCQSFKPMKKNERHVIHELASFYGLETESVDPEPQRNVIAYATFGVCKIPQTSLSEMIRREKLRIPPPVFHN